MNENNPNGALPATFSDSLRKLKKRPHPPVYNGFGPSEDKDTDLLCPVCFEMISEPYMTKCGHTFCFQCINTNLEFNKRCPKCSFPIESTNEVYPNFTLHEIISKHKAASPDKKFKLSHGSQQSSRVTELQALLGHSKNALTLDELNIVFELIARRKRQLETDCAESKILIMKEFLEKSKLTKQEELKTVQQQLKIIESDIKRVELMLRSHIATQNKLNQSNTLRTIPSSSTSSIPHTCALKNTLNNVCKPGPLCSKVLGSGSSSNQNSAPPLANPGPSTSQSVVQCSGSSSPNAIKEEPPLLKCTAQKQDGFNGSKYVHRMYISPTVANQRRRVHEHFNDLQQTYFNLRAKDMLHCSTDDMSGSGFEEFDKSLFQFTRFGGVRCLAVLHYANDQFTGSNIVSSIEFDKDNEFFSIAGVTKKIKVFDYSSVIKDALDIHYPSAEMLCNSKISCISYSTFHKSMMASSDYDGTVTLWDSFTCQKVKSYQEHEKRCWSVDFNKADPKLIASGSDDAKVKLWATNMDHSLGTLEAKANVCCVKFNPESRHRLAFGSADHCVHYYDLRNPSKALEIFRGHKKAVSYVKFLNGEEIVSASTDSQLKLWNVNQSYCVRSFKGHLNEKNFVGLATDGEYVTCGSENNALFVYYKGLSSPVLTFKFEAVKSILDKDKKEDDSNEFVSAVSWRNGSNVVVAANSQGNIRVLELV